MQPPAMISLAYALAIVLELGSTATSSPAEELRDTLTCLQQSDRFAFGQQSPNCGGRSSPSSYPPLEPRYPGMPSSGFVDCAAAVFANGTGDWPTCQDAHGTLTDLKALTGKHPGVYGFDWQWAVSAAYFEEPPVVPKTPRSLLTGFNYGPFIAAARAEGAIITIDFHMVSPLTLQPMDHSGNPIIALLPGGLANEMWTSWLDGVAQQLNSDPTNAFILRPFHEFTLGFNRSAPPGTPSKNFSGWWWAAGSGVSPAQYRAAYNYTRWYVEEFRGAKNALWAYAPNSPSTSTCNPPSPDCADVVYSTKETSYYPGDDVIDIVCFDRYGKDDYSEDLLADCRLAVQFAEAHGKIPAICETGIKNGIQNTNLTDYFTRVLLEPISNDPICSRIAYALTWTDGPLFNPPARPKRQPMHWLPVHGDPNAPDLIKFVADNRTVLAGEFGICGIPTKIGCGSDLDCSLLGTCDIQSGRCSCDLGWTGPTCSQAKLKPLNQSLGYHNTSAASWGGRPLVDPDDSNTWHLFVSQFANKCALAYWNHNSFVGRAISTSGAGGPYNLVEEVFPAFHHNPTAIGPTSDGFYLIFMIGQTNSSNVVDCRTNPAPFAPGSGMGGPVGTISMSASKSPKGPWSTPRVVLQNYKNPQQNQSDWDCYVTNPSGVILPNGSIALVFSSVPCEGGFEEALGYAVAEHWNSTYVENRGAIWRKPGPRQSPSELGVGNVEDPFAWRDHRGNYHIIGHSQGQSSVCGGTEWYPGAAGTGPGNACGVHFYATSINGPWHHSNTPTYTGIAPLVNGSTIHMTTRQRPQLIFEDDEVTPKYMVHGGSFDEYNRDTKSLERTFIFEFDLA